MKTPQEKQIKLAKFLEIPEIVFKREDKHKYKSHKGRSIPQMIDTYVKQGIDSFVISSSGNAALASLLYINELNKKNKNIKLTIYVGKQIEQEKLSILEKNITNKNIDLQKVERPKQSAFLMDKKKEAKLLRQSTNDLALEGYFELAKELSAIDDLEAIFIPTSSGTTAQGLAEAFEKLKIDPQIHIVQTTTCNPIAKNFYETLQVKEDKSLANAIVDNIAYRKNKIIKIIKDSQGSGWIANNNDIQTAINLVQKECRIKISPNSALSVAGLIMAKQSKWKFEGTVVCLITGN